MRRVPSWVGVCLLLAASVRSVYALGSFVEFESGPVRPLAITPDGTKLLATNIQDNRLEIFDVDGSGNLTPSASVPVGMEPVAVAARSNTEVWVVNHLSDSVSIVSLATSPPRVVNTLLVGDEPRDIVFAGTGGNRAFITTAHRGQNSGIPFSDFITEGLGRADVWVFDANAIGTGLGGTPLTVVELFGDTPRALAVSPDGGTVYAGVFQSGNRTTTVGEPLVCNYSNPSVQPGPCTVNGNSAPGGLPPPGVKNCAGQVGPEVGLIVRYNGSQWVDELGRNWSNMVKLDLPDQDVFKINANANPPAETGTPFAGVGTILFNMAVNPISGKVYVSNTEAKNERRFEGPGTCSTTVQGRLHQARITVLDGSSVLPRHLNKHLDYNVRPAPLADKVKSLATPTDMVVTPDGTTLYVAAFGSNAVGFFNTAQLEADTFVPTSTNHIALSGPGGPGGLALRGTRLYVYTRFDNGISTINTSTQSEIAHTTMFNPEPANVVNGRPVLYDATTTSSNGEASCSSCHVFGDFDSLAWDLGNPNDSEVTSPLTQKINIGDPDFFPMKGPMTTQSLRGLDNHGAMHWRGDRSVGVFGTDATDEALSFNNFIVAFPGLLGNDGQIPVADMQKFTAFILDVVYPPNPVRTLDNTLPVGSAEAQGLSLYNGAITDSFFNCNGCHRLNPGLGFFGTDGAASFENETQHMKVAHLRNAYQKIGMFGMADNPFVSSTEPTTNQGPQVRGFGFLHDGSIDTLHRFLGATVFSTNDTDQRNLEAFILGFPSTLAPIVGQQITRTGTNGATVDGRINLLIARANASFALFNQPGATECDLIVKGTIAGQPRGWFLDVSTDNFVPDKASDPVISDAALRALSNTPGQELTYTCVPPGSGVRMGIDRDNDNIRDGDEVGGTTTSTSTSSTSTSSTSTTSSSSSTTSTTTSSTTSTSVIGGTTTSSSTTSSSTSSSSTSTSSSSSTTSNPPTSTSTSTSSTTSTTIEGIGVEAVKLIVVYHAPPVDTAKVVFVARDAGITKGAGLDPAQISVDFDVRYDDNATAGAFNVPAGASNGTSGWLANKPTVAKFVNRAAPSGPTGAKVAVVKPGKLIKITGKSLGDVALDLMGAGDPGTQGVSTVFRVVNGAETNRHCSHFADCTYKVLGDGTGAKLVCRPGAPAACP